MKRLALILALSLFSALAWAETPYPWVLTVYGGGGSQFISSDSDTGMSSLTLSTPTFGASFGRHMSSRWSFELDGFWTRGTYDLPPRIDLATDMIFVPQMQRTRIYGGAMFLATIAQFSRSMDFFVAVGGIGGYEQQEELAPAGVFHAPTQDVGLKGGLAGGAGFNWWFSKGWGLRPEARYYAVVNGLSTFRYTAGIMHRF